MRTTLVSHGNSLLAPIIGLVLCAPKFLAGAMTPIADWVSSLQRVGGLLLSLDELNHRRSSAGREKTASPLGSVRSL